jgi:glutamyl-tRNA reductase
VSISHAAVELARTVFDTLENRKILIVGAGKMSVLAAKNLMCHGGKSIFVANRTFEKAQELAQSFGGKAIKYDNLYDYIATADIVISSTSAPEYVITKEKLEKARKGSRGRALFIIDIALPRDVDPAVNDINDVYLYDIDHLSNVVDANLAERQREVVHVEEIIKEEVRNYLSWVGTLMVVPTVIQMREKAHRMRMEELELAMKKLHHLTDRDKKIIESLSSTLINKMLHGPTMRLKTSTSEEETSQYLKSTRYLYGLDTNPDGKSPRHRGFIRNLLGKDIIADLPEPHRHT